jgi:hypothetical protein
MTEVILILASGLWVIEMTGQGSQIEARAIAGVPWSESVQSVEVGCYYWVEFVIEAIGNLVLT